MKPLVLECIIPGQRCRVLCNGTTRRASIWTPAQEGSQLGNRYLCANLTRREGEVRGGGVSYNNCLGYLFCVRTNQSLFLTGFGHVRALHCLVAMGRSIYRPSYIHKGNRTRLGDGGQLKIMHIMYS